MEEISTIKNRINRIFQLNETFWNDFENVAKIRTIKKSDTLVQYGSLLTERCFFVVEGGFSSAILMKNGDMKTVWFYYPNHFFVIPLMESMLFSIPSTYEITAMEDSVVIEIGHDTFNEWVKTYPDFSMFSYSQILKDFYEVDRIRAQRLVRSHKEFIEFMFQTYPSIMEKTTDRLIAEFVGISAEWYSKLKKQLKTENSLL